jgi:hypothetical protein
MRSTRRTRVLPFVSTLSGVALARTPQYALRHPGFVRLSLSWQYTTRGRDQSTRTRCGDPLQGFLETNERLVNVDWAAA